MKSFVFLAPTVLLVFALAGCSPSSGGNNAASDNTTTGSSGNEASANSVIVPSSSATPLTSERAKLLSTVWVPGSDDKLHAKAVSKAALDTQKKYGNPTAALNDIIRMAPKSFPPKSEVQSFNDDGKTVSINLNRAFEDANFWSKAGEGDTRLSVYAIVNSASSAVGNKAVVLKIDNSTFDHLGEFATDGEIEPNLSMQSGATSGKASSGGA